MVAFEETPASRGKPLYASQPAAFPAETGVIDLDSSITKTWEKLTLAAIQQQFRSRPGLRQEFSDIRQELFLHVWRKLPLYSPKRSSLKTFIWRIVANQLVSLERARLTHCRGGNSKQVSLNRSQCPLSQQTSDMDVSQHDLDRKHQRKRLNTFQLVELTHDLNVIAKRLSPLQRKICDTLRSCTIVDTAAFLGIPRATLHDHLLRIRARFLDEGLQHYLT